MTPFDMSQKENVRGAISFDEFKWLKQALAVPVRKVLDSYPLHAYNSVNDVIVIGIDPGETTGICCVNYDIAEDMIYWIATEIATKPAPKPVEGEYKDYLFTRGIDRIEKWIQDERLLNYDGCSLTRIVIEDYHVYSWKTADHAWSNIYTLQLIGALRDRMERDLRYEEGYNDMRGVPRSEYVMQTAQEGKTFFKDVFLRGMNIYDDTAGMPHARDALRHALQYVTFKSPEALKQAIAYKDSK